MNGYLMQEQSWTPGEDFFLESFSPENRYGVVFEDDGESAYFYAVEKDEQGTGVRILDALHIHEAEEGDPAEENDPAEEDGPPEESETSGEDGPLEEDERPEGWDDPADLKIIWSRDWLKCALILDGYVYALFDFENQGGYNINEFPPPNSIWTHSDRKLTPELIARFF
jgi:hypothetical protein